MAELSSPLVRLAAFRAELPACCTRRTDALLELGDALLCAPTIPSIAHLSLEPVHRRGWAAPTPPSPVADWTASGSATCWPATRWTVACRSTPSTPPAGRAATPTAAPARLVLPPSRHSAGQPIVAGWAFQWIAQLSFTRDSWTAPLDARRLHPLDNHNQVAVAQIRALLDRLPASGPVPLFVFDAGYDPTGLALGLAEAPAAILVRLRSGRCFYADPPARVATGKGGRPRRHGAKLNTRPPGHLAGADDQPRRGQ